MLSIKIKKDKLAGEWKHYIPLHTHITANFFSARYSGQVPKQVDHVNQKN